MSFETISKQLKSYGNNVKLIQQGWNQNDLGNCFFINTSTAKLVLRLQSIKSYRMQPKQQILLFWLLRKNREMLGKSKKIINLLWVDTFLFVVVFLNEKYFSRKSL